MAEHQSAARREDMAAGMHAEQYNADAATTRTRCPGGFNSFVADGACWTSTRNPTAKHLEEASKHRKMAADHRAASKGLSSVEEQTCRGVSDEDRDTSPFEHREDITHVEPLVVQHLSDKSAHELMEGALVTFRATPGMTAPWLQRVVDCHLARNAALGHSGVGMEACPLVPKDTVATVAETRTGFAVSIRSSDPRSAKEILRRAELLRPGH